MKNKYGLFIVIIAIFIGIISVSWVVPKLGKKNFLPVFLKGNRLGNSIIYDTNRDLGSIRNIGIGTTKPTETLDVNGTAQAKAFKLNGIKITEWPTSTGIPNGGIIMWSGSSVPTGWALCDGTAPTPDLRDRFIVCSGNEYKIGDNGGEKMHKLTISEMPKHHHSYQHHPTEKFSGSTETAGKGPLQTYQTGDTGGDQPHENRPPYYALAFIMKL